MRLQRRKSLKGQNETLLILFINYSLNKVFEATFSNSFDISNYLSLSFPSLAPSSFTSLCFPCLLPQSLPHLTLPCQSLSPVSSFSSTFFLPFSFPPPAWFQTFPCLFFLCITVKLSEV